jgi:hypothetical protein
MRDRIMAEMQEAAKQRAASMNIVVLHGDDKPASPFNEVDTSARRFPWPQTGSIICDWDMEGCVLEALRTSDGVIMRDFTLAGVETLFRLRALQLLTPEPRLNLPSAIFIAEAETIALLVPGLCRRIASSWPFASVVFVAEGAAGAALGAEGLPVVSLSEAERLGYAGLLAMPGAISAAAADQAIGVHIQPLWGRCGSSTAFANELDTLIDAGLFVLRVFIDHERRFGATTLRQFPQFVAENTIDSGPHLESLAAAREIGAPLQGDEFSAFFHSATTRTRSSIVDSVAARLARRAQTAIVNHAVNVGFAGKVCPEARIVLDTHDYLTRNAVERVRGVAGAKAFPDCAAMRRHVALEQRLWQAADACTTVSQDEEKRIRRHNAHCLMVFPKPYVKPWNDPGSDAEWDILLVADQHFFNVSSVSWFLEEVVSRNARLKTARIAIVGQVRRRLEPLWTQKLPNVKWLGFVHDLEETRATTRVAVCPDRAGTGISVKALTALAAGQPLVATSAAFRGMPDDVAATVSVFDDPKAMARDLIALMDDPEKLRARRDNVLRAREILQHAASYATAVDEARCREGAVARQALIDDFSRLEPVAPEHPEIRNGVIRLGFEQGGAAEPFIGVGWHNGERWGRWIDGKSALLSIPRAWLRDAVEIEIRFIDAKFTTGVALFYDGRRLTRANLTTRDRAAYVSVDAALKTGSEMATFDFMVESEHCPTELGFWSDTRVLGLGLRSFSIATTQTARWKLRAKQALIGRLGRR